MSYRWAVLAAGTAAQASFSAISFAVAVLAPALRDRYDLSLTEVGVVLAAEWIGLTFALLPWGFAVDRWGERWTLAGGLGVCASLLAGAAFAPSFAWLVVLLLLAGVAGGSVQSGSGRAVMRWFAADERGLALGVRQTAVPIGGGIAALVLPLLGGSRAGFLFLAGFVLAGAIGGALVLRTGMAEHVGVDEVDSSLHDRALWLLCGGSGFYLVAQIATMSFLVLFLVDARGWSTGSAAAVLAAGQVVAAGLRIGVGRWSDTLRARVRPLRLVGIAVAIALAFVATLADAPESVLVPLLVVTTGLSMAWNGLSFTIAAEIGGRRSGAAIGLQQTVLSAVGVVAPIAFAATVSWSSWRAAFGLAAVFPVVGWLLLGSLRDRDGRVGAGHAPLSRSSAAAPRPDRP
ncbi:MAG: MFS transporter [Actinomycetota bacterium]|nr:MFS transporter [Actinomycetota bacterium]